MYVFTRLFSLLLYAIVHSLMMSYTARPVVKCPLTGRPAIYRDPRSGVPYANVEAYQTLSKIIAHEYIWNEELQCYTASDRSLQIEEEADDGGQTH